MTTKQELQEQVNKLQKELSVCQNQMKTTQEELDKLYAQVNSASDEVEIIRWRAQQGAQYYIISGFGEVLVETERNDFNSNNYFALGNYFKTEQEAKDHKENLLTKQKLKDLALRLNKGAKIDWSTVFAKKYHIMYNYYQNKLWQVHEETWTDMGQVYCLDSNFLEIAKKEIGEDKLIKLIKSGV